MYQSKSFTSTLRDGSVTANRPVSVLRRIWATTAFR